MGLALGAYRRGRRDPIPSPHCVYGRGPSAVLNVLSKSTYRFMYCPAHFPGTWRKSGEITEEQMLVNCYYDCVAVVAADMLHKVLRYFHHTF